MLRKSYAKMCLSSFWNTKALGIIKYPFLMESICFTSNISYWFTVCTMSCMVSEWSMIGILITESSFFGYNYVLWLLWFDCLPTLRVVPRVALLVGMGALIGDIREELWSSGHASRDNFYAASCILMRRVFCITPGFRWNCRHLQASMMQPSEGHLLSLYYTTCGLNMQK